MSFYNEDNLFVPNPEDHPNWFARLTMFADKADIMNTPIECIEAIKSTIQNKKICDVGCNNGKTALLLKKYAAEVFGIEKDPSLAIEARQKGIEVIEGDIVNIGLPPADYYFIWYGDVNMVKSWVSHITGIHSDAKFIINHCLELENESEYCDSLGGNKISYTAQGCSWKVTIT